MLYFNSLKIYATHTTENLIIESSLEWIKFYNATFIWWIFKLLPPNLHIQSFKSFALKELNTFIKQLSMDYIEQKWQ